MNVWVVSINLWTSRKATIYDVEMSKSNRRNHQNAIRKKLILTKKKKTIINKYNKLNSHQRFSMEWKNNFQAFFTTVLKILRDQILNFVQTQVAKLYTK